MHSFREMLGASILAYVGGWLWPWRLSRLRYVWVAATLLWQLKHLLDVHTHTVNWALGAP